MRRRIETVDAMAPRPVHPRAVRFHGLFGMPFIRQHMMVDKRWTPSCLMEEFKGMNDLLAKRLHFKRLEFAENRKNSMNEYRNLRRQCWDGRQKLQMSLFGSNMKQIRNFLINHKDMQRLYQRMPIHNIVENINQRTFSLRKESDRLGYRLKQLKGEYKSHLLERATLENRIKYEDEFVLDEEIKSREFRKKLENSHVRLKAIRTINGTYKKMIQILRHDSIYYDPILRSLSADIDDQQQFIKHILYVGKPAVATSKELREIYRLAEERAHKSTHMKLQWMAAFKKNERKNFGYSTKSKGDETISMLKRYVRETDSMLALKSELENIEEIIKQVKFITLCSQAKEIFPRMKTQQDNNEKLLKKIENDGLSREALEMKMKRSQIVKDVLVNNFTSEEIERLRKMAELRELISQEEEMEAKTLENMRKQADAFVLFRYCAWNLNEMLRHIDRPPRNPPIKYPEAYLSLPLLKFEMLVMRACPPDNYEPNIDELMNVVKRKIQRLMSAYKTEITQPEIEQYAEDYHFHYLSSLDIDELMDDTEVAQIDENEDLLEETKTLQNIPTRKQLKSQSVKIVEENAKKDDA